MVADEDMAVRFYEPGNAVDLAEQLIAILQSPAHEYEMAEQNHIAGLEMMIGNVVNNYIRWFKLQRCKRMLRKSGAGDKQRLQRTAVDDPMTSFDAADPESGLLTRAGSQASDIRDLSAAHPRVDASEC